MSRRIWLVGLVGVLVTIGTVRAGTANPGSQGQAFACDARTLHGTYGTQMQGTRPVCTIVIAGSAGAFAQTPASEDAVWADFVTWLDTMPPPTEVVSVIQLYSQALAGRGAGPEDVKRTIADILRLMRDRPDAWRPIFNRIYANADATFSREPTSLLVDAVEGRTPGRALDVGMGQGRNAVFLAVKGWDVVGFDLAEAGLEVARAQATRAGVSLQAVQADAATFDYGRDAWDLIVITYGPRFVAEGVFPDRRLNVA